MQIVIEISEKEYNYYKDASNFWGYSKLREIILNGTPLPKGHGNLKDADELLTSERPKGIADDVWKESHIYKLLSNAPTIIEADKEQTL